tara:strand:+ start:6161 stop:6871 length:711 start_codon:yes stop_codon:yes gene_type:complete
MKKTIKREGYLVVKGVLDETGIKRAMDLFTKHDNTEIVGGFDFESTHSPFSNYLRSHPKIVKQFADFWGTDDLLPSLDSPIVWHDGAPVIEGLHVDQNPYWKRGFKCLQGMVHLSTTDVGGLQIVPRTNTAGVQNKLVRLYPYIKKTKDDWLELADNPSRRAEVKIPCVAGDMVFWDSRSVHGAYIGDAGDERPRISFPICMMPRAMVSEEVLKKRKEAIRKGITLTHWVNKAELH